MINANNDDNEYIDEDDNRNDAKDNFDNEE